MIPEKVINENEYRKKELTELVSLRDEIAEVLKIPREKQINLRDDVNLWILNDLIREKE
jgi:hypothetical protein